MLTFIRIQISILIFVLFSASIAQTSESTGMLSVDLKQNGYVYLNSELIASESFQNLALNPGTYQLSVFSSDSRNWSQRGQNQEINIVSDQTLELSVDFDEDYYVNSAPYNSKIFQNNKLIGITPAFISRQMIDDSGILELKKEGFKDKELKISPNQNSYFTKLTTKSNFDAPQLAKPVLNNSQTSWMKEGLVAVTLLSSWGAFYFKREADKNYDKYMSTGNPAKMNKYFDNTQRFDSFADISIGLSVAALGTYMYLLIFE